MNITPNIRIYQDTVQNITNNSSVSIITIPDTINAANIDSDSIEMIRNQALPNDIKTYSQSGMKTEIEDMTKLLGAYCQQNSIQKIKDIVNSIHSKLNSKQPGTIKSWIRVLKGIHPKVDEYIKQNKEYFKNPFSEIIGTNTIIYYADMSSIDIWYWAREPKYLNNNVEWFLTPWNSPSYLRENIRHKLSSEVVQYIMSANHVLTKRFRDSIIYDALTTTEDNTGREVAQTRPIDASIAHGAALNNDWYHQEKRIFASCKSACRDYAKNKIDEGGCLVHLLVNHMTPLITSKKAEDRKIKWKTPLGVEETFPRTNSSLEVTTHNAGQKDLPILTTINDDPLKPETITLPQGLII